MLARGVTSVLVPAIAHHRPIEMNPRECASESRVDALVAQDPELTSQWWVSTFPGIDFPHGGARRRFPLRPASRRDRLAPAPSPNRPQGLDVYSVISAENTRKSEILSSSMHAR